MDHAKCFVVGPFAFLLRVSRFLGLAPLYFTKHGTGWYISLSSRYSKIGSFVFTISILFMCSSVIWISLYEESKNNFVWASAVSMSTGMTAAMIYNARKQTQCLIQTMIQVQQVNSKFKNHCKPWTKKKLILFVVWGTFGISIMLNLFLAFMDLIFGVKKTQPELKLTVNVIRSLFNALIQIGVAQFVLFALHVKTCFTTVNHQLRNILQGLKQKRPSKIKSVRVNNYVSSTSKNIDSDDVTTPSLSYMSVRRVSTAYVQACDIVRSVNAVYGIYLSILLIFTFSNLVVASYYFIVTLVIYGFSTVAIIFEVFQVSWVIYHLMNLVMFIEPCHLTYSEMEITRELVSHLMQRAHSAYDPLAVELLQFHQQILLNDVCYKPLNIIKISRTLILTVTGSITTYLIILIDTKPTL